MTIIPTAKQALFLWKMISAETHELREPKLGEVTPRLDPTKERQPLIDAQFLEKVRRGRGSHLVLTDKAWRWAAQYADVEIMKSCSRDGAIALQGLLRALVPFLRDHDLSLAEVIQSRDKGQGHSVVATTGKASRPSGNGVSLEFQIRQICDDLTSHDLTRAIRLSSLRAALPAVSRHTLDIELRRMQDGGSVALYRDDNTARITAEDTRDALMVGDEPRHILYLKD